MPANKDIYQVICTNAECGRNIKQSKRCVRWKFGLVNQEAITNGATGRDCCGEEHEVKLIWSITSGKQRLLFDNRVVHFAKLGLGERQKGIFAFKWKSLGLDFSVCAYAAPPIRYQEDWKQYDLLINGCSFDDHLCIFQLGVNTIEDPINIPRITDSSHCEDGEKSTEEKLEKDKSVGTVDESENNTNDQKFAFYADFERHCPGDKIIEGQECNQDDDDDEISVISSLLQRRDKSDEFDKSGIEINPNEPPTLEVLKRVQECEEDNVEEKTVFRYDDIWGNVFDPFGLKDPSESCTSSKEQKPKRKVSRSPRSVVDKQRASLRLHFRNNRCLHSLTRPSLKPRGETFDRQQTKYEEMQGNDEPIF